jgi:2-amino-4-hydroxy-6-hydroxymethyldihydropteridine diphosphokinase
MTRLDSHRQQSCSPWSRSAAVQALSEIPQSRVVTVVFFTHTTAGPQDQPDYLNAAVV